MEIEPYFPIAFDLAKRLKPVGAARVISLLIHKNAIISIGYNHYRSHPFQKRFATNPHAIYWHSEVHAIYLALKTHSLKQISKSTLIVCRARQVNGNWEYGLSKPCSGCHFCIQTYQIPYVYFSKNGGEIGNDLN